ncbi:MAG TPA: hypothetical protein PKH24_05240 [Sedimentisphaerales bacterium]|jgi:hypothetical protein|nr:hypothetical protein [Sedimentisphaerales bacterium]HNU29047.1 hypothetical protein [Sedimentisphaerales bacterium]
MVHYEAKGAVEVDAKSISNATTLLMALYCEDGGARVPAAIQTVKLTNTMTEYTLRLTAASAPDCVGKKIGIELTNVGVNPLGRLALDSIRLGPAQ